MREHSKITKWVWLGALTFGVAVNIGLVAIFNAVA